MSTDFRDMRLKPQEAGTLRDALTRYLPRLYGTKAQLVRMARDAIPIHAPYDIMLVSSTWAACSVALRWAGAVNERVITRTPEQLAAQALYLRMYKVMRWPSAEHQRGRGKMARGRVP